MVNPIPLAAIGLILLLLRRGFLWAWSGFCFYAASPTPCLRS